MALIICERTYQTPLSLDRFRAAVRTHNPCFDVRGVRWLGSVLANDGLKVVCRYEASDAESVRQANREAGLAFERIWAAEEILP
jgi:hypothetical protein